MGRDNEQIILLFFDGRNDLVDRLAFPDPFCDFETISLLGFYDAVYIFSGFFLPDFRIPALGTESVNSILPRRMGRELHAKQEVLLISANGNLNI